MLTNIHVWVGLATCALVATPWQRAAGEQRRDVPVRDVAAIVRVVLESRLPKPADDGRRAPFTYFVEIEGWNAAEVLRELRQRHPSWLSTQQKLGTTLKPHSEMVTNATGCAVDSSLDQPGVGIGVGTFEVIGGGRVKVDVGYFMCPHMSGEDTYELVKNGAEWRIAATRAKWRTWQAVVKSPHSLRDTENSLSCVRGTEPSRGFLLPPCLCTQGASLASQPVRLLPRAART